VAVLKPHHLLEQAELLLCTKNPRGKVRQVNQRRAISAAYYAVFHFTLTAVADQFIGKAERKSLRYALAYRSIDHGKLEALCKVAKSNKIDANTRYAKFVTGDSFAKPIREFASLLLELKEKRNLADYDPSYRAQITDARNTILAARSAIEKFEQSKLDDKIIFLSLLAFPSR
jgi:hypothetical protein